MPRRLRSLARRWQVLAGQGGTRGPGGGADQGSSLRRAGTEGFICGDDALVGVQHRAEVPVSRYVATDDLSEVTCLQCRRSLLWRQALKDPSEVARYRPRCEAYEEEIRADRARFF